jgi:hypothetical protein
MEWLREQDHSDPLMEKIFILVGLNLIMGQARLISVIAGLKGLEIDEALAKTVGNL